MFTCPFFHGVFNYREWIGANLLYCSVVVFRECCFVSDFKFFFLISFLKNRPKCVRELAFSSCEISKK